MVLLATACGGPTNDWRFQGDPVREVEESLATIEDRWRAEIGAADVAIAVPEDAGCYLQLGRVS